MVSETGSGHLAEPGPEMHSEECLGSFTRRNPAIPTALRWHLLCRRDRPAGAPRNESLLVQSYMYKGHGLGCTNLLPCREMETAAQTQPGCRSPTSPSYYIVVVAKIILTWTRTLPREHRCWLNPPSHRHAGETSSRLSTIPPLLCSDLARWRGLLQAVSATGRHETNSRPYST